MQLTNYIVLDSTEQAVLQQVIRYANGLDVFDSFDSIAPDELINFTEKSNKLIDSINSFNLLVTKLRKSMTPDQTGISQETQTLDWLSKL